MGKRIDIDMVAAAERAAEALIGTALDLAEVEPDELTRNDTTFCERLDERVLCCTVCGWWVEADDTTEKSGEIVCTECAE